MTSPQLASNPELKRMAWGWYKKEGMSPTTADMNSLVELLGSVTLPDNGLKLAVGLASDDLDAIEDYFDQRADADADSEGTYPNEELRLLQAVRRVQALHKRIAEDKRTPATRVGYSTMEAP